MIRLSKMADYAVLLLTHMAGRDTGPFAASALAVETGLAEPTAAKVLKLLAAGGIVLSTRGIKGGYALARPCADISVAEVIAAVDGPISITSCVDGSDETCQLENICRLKGRWDPVNRAIVTALENVALADLMGDMNTQAKAAARA